MVKLLSLVEETLGLRMRYSFNQGDVGVFLKEKVKPGCSLSGLVKNVYRNETDVVLDPLLFGMCPGAVEH